MIIYFYILQDDGDNCIQGSPIICTIQPTSMLVVLWSERWYD